MKSKILNEAKVIGLAIVGGGIALGALFAVLPFLPKGDPQIGGMSAPKVGETMFIGRGNCDRAVKAILRDPDSYQRIGQQIIDVKPGKGWAAQVDFRSRNGFGGYAEGTAYCVFNGSEYRALIDE